VMKATKPAARAVPASSETSLAVAAADVTIRLTRIWIGATTTTTIRTRVQKWRRQILRATSMISPTASGRSSGTEDTGRHTTERLPGARGVPEEVSGAGARRHRPHRVSAEAYSVWRVAPAGWSIKEGSGPATMP